MFLFLLESLFKLKPGIRCFRHQIFIDCINIFMRHETSHHNFLYVIWVFFMRLIIYLILVVYLFNIITLRSHECSKPPDIVNKIFNDNLGYFMERQKTNRIIDSFRQNVFCKNPVFNTRTKHLVLKKFLRNIL